MSGSPLELHVELDSDQLDELAELLADRLTEKVAARLAANHAAAWNHGAGSGDETLDEFVKRLPRCKPAKRWRRWMYEHLQRGEVPVPEVAYKAGNLWLIRPEKGLAWFEGHRP